MERENVTFSHFDPDYLSENSSNETSNRRVKKVLTNKPAKLRIDSILVSIVCFCPRRVFTSSRIRTSSLADRWPAYLRRSPRLTQRNGRGQGITLDPEKERWRRDIFPVSNACHYYYRCYYYYYYYSMDRE